MDNNPSPNVPVPRRHPTVGMRSIKTALSAALCALIYAVIGRNPTFACIGAVFGMGQDMHDSHRHGGNRFFGTLIGGLLGMALFRFYLIFYPDGKPHFLLVVLTFIGVVALIYLCQIFWVGGVQPGSVILCIILFNTPPESYVAYSLNRIADTGAGVLMSLAINWFLPRHQVLRVMIPVKRLLRIPLTEEDKGILEESNK